MVLWYEVRGQGIKHDLYIPQNCVQVSSVAKKGCLVVFQYSGMVCLCSATCYTCKAVQSDSLFGGTKLSRLLSKRLHLELSLAFSSAAGFIRRVFFTTVTLLNTNLSPLVCTTLFMSLCTSC